MCNSLKCRESRNDKADLELHSTEQRRACPASSNARGSEPLVGFQGRGVRVPRTVRLIDLIGGSDNDEKGSKRDTQKIGFAFFLSRSEISRRDLKLVSQVYKYEEL